MFMHQNGWGNQVTIISQGTTTKTISYDYAGNPTNYKGATLTWTRGRLLASYKPSGSSYTTTMQYDANGVRCSKTIPTSTQPNVFRYVYDGNNLVRETKSGTSSYTKTFLYNSQGIIGFAIGSTVYTYRKNLFGDIIAIYQGATKKAAYVYDAWGNCTITQDTDGIGTANPFRYRGYYWDNDLQLYYLMSRYYDPQTGRFINADESKTLFWGKHIILALNRYSYCFDNPIYYIDDMGLWPQRRNFIPRKPKRKGADKRQPTGERERNVGHPNAEEHSRRAKGGNRRKMEYHKYEQLFGNYITILVVDYSNQQHYIFDTSSFIPNNEKQGESEVLNKPVVLPFPWESSDLLNSREQLPFNNNANLPTIFTTLVPIIILGGGKYLINHKDFDYGK